MRLNSALMSYDHPWRGEGTGGLRWCYYYVVVMGFGLGAIVVVDRVLGEASTAQAMA